MEILTFSAFTIAFLWIIHGMRRDLNRERERYRAIAEALAAKEGAVVAPLPPEVAIIENAFGKFITQPREFKVPPPIWPAE